ncbi:tetratricopeptide repeat protein [Polymorphobacter fuscus]|nr:tetratricopeptide repeat protein [Polymorphobacter fuscus]NJC10058.1 tetratricopeptide (TPR) repeat protein [Polymorphobacter fuscus]
MLVGCATGGARGSSALQGCYDAANGLVAVAPGLAACNRAIAATGLPDELRAATLVNRGIVRMNARQYDSAIADYDAALALAPGNADAWLDKGIALVRMGGRDAEALTVLTTALDHDPRKPELVYYHRAAANENLGRLRAAYEDYAEAAQLAPGWSEPTMQLQRFKFIRRKALAG